MSASAAFLTETCQIAQSLDARELDRLAQLLSLVQGRIYFAGLGGSAANASHAAADFRRLCDRDAVCLSDSVASFSACANDDGWAEAFVSQMSRANVQDALFVLSVGGGFSGNPMQSPVSVPLIRAVSFARERGMQVFGIVGRDGGFTKQHGDCVIVVPCVVPSRVTPQVEGWQMTLLHLLVSHPALQRRATKW